MAGAVELARRHRLDRVAARKQPALRPRRLPPGAQQLEQLRRQHDVAVLAALALLDADHHALAVDVGDLERDHLGDAQARAVGDAQRRLVLEPGAASSSRAHLLGAQHHRQLARLVDERRCARRSRAASSVTLKKNRSADDGLIEGRDADAARRQMQLKAAQVLEARRVGRAAEERGEVLDRCGCSHACVFGANLRIVMSSIMRRRNGLMASSVMGMLLS